MEERQSLQNYTCRKIYEEKQWSWYPFNFCLKKLNKERKNTFFCYFELYKGYKVSDKVKASAILLHFCLFLGSLLKGVSQLYAK